MVMSAAGAWGATASRAVPSTDTATPSRTIASQSETRATSGAETAAASAGAARTATTAPSRTTAASRVVSTDNTAGARATTPSRTTASRSAGVQTTRDNLDAAVNTVGRNARVTAASINNTAAVRRAGVSLRPSTAEVGGRATIGTSGVQTGSNIKGEVRSVGARAATTASVTPRETAAEAKERLEQTADLNKSCQDQYNDCMDQFCAVIDANQKRCSCSANLSRYTRVESAVKDANTQLNDVAQRIRYVGLSADEIRAIMSATEAEDALTGARDTTESRSMLDEIEAMIVNPNSVASTTTNNSSSLMDLDLSFSGDDANMFNLDFLADTSTNTMTNLRGTELFNAAKKRCNTILTQCRNVGASADQITANYELAIDKDCIAYEQGLNKMNDSLKTNVRSANLMLQKARLAVLQNKNQYDAKGCVSALNACMIDDMVCGENYTKCLDPTKRYIDENGNVVLGQNIGQILEFMKNYDNSKINTDFVEQSMNSQFDVSDGKGIVRYLMQKIGTGDKVTDGGLCRPVLDKCQRFTYSTASNSKYNPYNDIVVNYIQRAMVNIRAAQTEIISDYASTCMTDIATCYSQQVSQVNSWSASASVDSIYRVMSGACYNVALTCAYAVFHETPDHCPKDETGKNKCIESISEMFYQSMLCPANSTYLSAKQTEIGNFTDDAKTIPFTKNADKTDYSTIKVAIVNDHCQCIPGYVVQNNGCLPACPLGKWYATNTATQCTDIKESK